MPEKPTASNRTAIVIGMIGIALEAVTIALLASNRLPSRIATPIIVVGMLLAFVPIFVLARRARRGR